MPRYEPFDWYHTPVYYDIIFDTDTAGEATFLEQVAQRHAVSPAELQTMPTAPRSDAAGPPAAPTTGPLAILEPACGSGRLMAELAARGHRVAGVDLSKGMLDFARQRFDERGVRGKLVNAPMQDFDLHAFAAKADGSDLAHILVSSFKYLLTEADAAACLRCICDHLRVGGVLALGLHLTDPDDDGAQLERWRAKRDGIDVLCTIKSWPPDAKTRLEAIRSRIVARFGDGSPEQRYETNWHFRTYTPRQLKSLLRKEPRFKHVQTYTFHHDIDRPTSLDGDDLGVVLVLRREA